jgi:5-(carboxyamino)imidazole ribonucleotide synthase
VRLEGPESLQQAATLLESVPGIVEGWIDFRCELSVVVARNPQGQTATYGPMRNDHADHILDVSVVPAELGPAIERDAVTLARNVADALAVEGLLCVEMFLTRNGELLVNELAPRPHNSGHLTIEGFESSQFDQQVRTLCALDLGSTAAMAPAAAMANLLGDLWIDGEPKAEAAAGPGIFVHVYGKAEARRRRKMGHITALGETPEEARAKAVAAREAFGGAQSGKDLPVPTTEPRA